MEVSRSDWVMISSSSERVPEKGIHLSLRELGDPVPFTLDFLVIVVKVKSINLFISSSRSDFVDLTFLYYFGQIMETFLYQARVFPFDLS